MAYLPRALIFDELNSGQLISVLDEFSSKTLGIYAVYPKARVADPKLTLLVDHFRQALRQSKGQFSERSF